MSSPFDPSRDAIFVGAGGAPDLYHRVLLPARELGCDWIGLDAMPPRMRYGRGTVRGRYAVPALADYRVVVLQKPNDPGWFDLVPELQGRGVVVLYDVDDFFHGRRLEPETIALAESMMRMADGIICATDYLAERYEVLNDRIFVCPNAIDLDDYAVTRPDHNTTNVGWAGLRLSAEAMRPWLLELVPVIRARPPVNFISIGQPYADVLVELGVVDPGRCLTIPAILADQYPAALSLVDIAIAPADIGEFGQGRSDLRWLEAGALEIPLVASPTGFGAIEHGVTGLHATTAGAAARAVLQLIDDPGLRARIGQAACAEIRRTRTIGAVIDRWTDAFEAVLR